MRHRDTAVVSDAQLTTAVEALVSIASDNSGRVDAQVRVQAASTILGNAFDYEYPTPALDEPEPGEEV